MSVPVTIEGVKYFATLPSLADFRTFKQFLAKRRRQKWCAAVPAGLSDDELKRWMRIIDEECESIDPFKSFGALADDADGAALLFHSLLRHENPNITLTFVAGVIDRAVEGKPAALEAVRELKLAIKEMLEEKKREVEAKLPPKSETAELPPSQSAPSTSPSAQDTDSAPQ